MFQLNEGFAQQVIRRSETELEVTLDDTLGPIYYRLLLTGAPVDDEYLWDLIVSLPWSPAEHLKQVNTA